MALRRLPGVRIGPTGSLIADICALYAKNSEIYISSGMDGDHGAVSHHYGLSYAKSPTAALDIGAGGVTTAGSRRMRDFAKWVYDTFAGDVVELIHTTPYDTDRGFYVKHGRRYPGGGPYAGSTARAHRNHVHLAMSKAQAIGVLAALRKAPAPRSTTKPVSRQARHPNSTVVANIRPVFGWDASDHDFRRGDMDLGAACKAGISFFTSKCTEGETFNASSYKTHLHRARAAEIPVLGAYHVLWPGSVASAQREARKFFTRVNTLTPWWSSVPWIWQLDSEKFKKMKRAPNAKEGKAFLDELKRLAEGRGWFIAYAPRWQYHDGFDIGYDLWASDYRGSGAARPFDDQWSSVRISPTNVRFRAYSGRRPRILQFASDATIGRQMTCDANVFDGDLHALVRLTGRVPVQPP